MVAQPSQSSHPAETAETTPAETNAIEQILAKLQHFSPERQQQVLDFVEFLDQKTQPQPAEKTIWEEVDELMAEVPDEEWKKLPTDGSYQHDHYLYGTPKREL
ncbi:DUF2281 domain-containing protein [Egbenema bharatensis]|uniref:DUF2281 domain-containing protein n=1 Tax=Egbenema bharatensis TaxID=3463334 RepID=UPI003A8A80BE